MSIEAPKIDERTYDDIVAETEALAQDVTDWRPRTDGQADAGQALIRIFGRMTELVINRLNQVPDKNFTAFLDLIGTQILPPQPARVPLTFHLAAGSVEETLVPVPARTQVAASPAEGDEGEIIFETDADLMVTTAQLTAVFVREPDTDRYGDYTQPDDAFPAFAAPDRVVGAQPIEHRLYLARDDFFRLPGPKRVILTIDSPDASDLSALSIAWSYWDGTNWQDLTGSVSSSAEGNQWQVTIEDLPAPALQVINGVEAGWLRAQLDDPLPPGSATPSIEQIAARVELTHSDLSPDLAFINALSLDLSKDFYPFGEEPAFNDTLYLSSQEVFANAGATITIDVALSASVVAEASADLTIAWEVWNGQAWQVLGQSTASAEALEGSTSGFSDGTQAFTSDGQVTFVLPSEMGEGTVNGEIGYWIRARIVEGNYGTEAYYVSNNEGGYDLVLDTFAPPSVASLNLGYTHEPSGTLAACYTYNDFAYVDCTAEAAEANGSSFTPFAPTADTQPTLYLGFDRPFANRSVALYAGVEPMLYSETASESSTDDTGQVTWEYASSSGWARLGAQDETRAFAERGLITFIGPEDFTARTEFGLSRYWLRARWEGEPPSTSPRLQRLLTNTTWASQSTTIQNETLGSSTGEQNQIFSTTKAPVLLDPQIEVREPDMPSASEQATIEREEGEDAITTILDASGQPTEIWVRWHEVTDFYGSGSRDRHYVVDYSTGEVYFGDGQNGLAPPVDHNNIRATLYRTGGGSQGDRPAGTITQLKSTTPYVDGVTNYEAAGGGADQETVEDVKERAPQSLRHRDRAVAAQDFEDLAYLASSDVARAQAITPHYEPFNDQWDASYENEPDDGQVGLIIVPQSTDSQPRPSLELINRVEDYILARCSPTLDLWTGEPEWVEVTVTAEVVPASAQAANDLETTVVSALQDSLHPLTGGSDGQGWAFGREPHRSDLYARIESVDGVDHVRSLTVQEVPGIPGLSGTKLDQFLIYSGPHNISLVSAA